MIPKKLINYSGKTKEEYNDEPVYYCKACLSLHVENDGDSGSYCAKCGCSSIGRTSIQIWDEAYKQKYEKEFLTDYDIPYEKCKHCEHTDGCK